MEQNERRSTGTVFRKVLSILMAMLLVMSTVSVALAGEKYGEVVANGYCGAEDGNLEWSLYEDGTLVVSGSGEMDGSTIPWYDYSFNYEFDIKKIIISEGITHICNFFHLDKVISVSLPESLECIGDRTFEGCSSFKTVHIPENVTSIYEDAFLNCSSLEMFTVDDNNPCYYADEYGCLYSYYVDYWGDMVPYINDELIKIPEASKMTEYTINENVTVVGWYAFSDTKNLKKVTVKDEDTYVYNFGGDSSSVELVEGYAVSPAYFAALKDGKTFKSIDENDVSDVEMTRLPYKLEFEIYDEIDFSGMVVTFTLEDGNKIIVQEGNYLTDCYYDLSSEGEKNVSVFYGEKEFEYTITVFSERYLKTGEGYEFNSYNNQSNNFYLVSEDTGDYTIKIGLDESCDVSVFECCEEEIYDDESEEVVVESWLEEIACEYYDYEDVKNLTVTFEEGKKYKIYIYVNGRDGVIPSTISVIEGAEVEEPFDYGWPLDTEDCGADKTNAYFMYYNTGIVVIGGTGEMCDYGNGSSLAPWYYNDCNAVFITKGITRIGDNTFCNPEQNITFYFSGTEEEWNEIEIGENNIIENVVFGIAPCGHPVDVREYEAPACTQDGVAVEATCNVCGSLLNLAGRIPARHNDTSPVDGKCDYCDDKASDIIADESFVIEGWTEDLVFIPTVSGDYAFTSDRGSVEVSLYDDHHRSLNGAWAEGDTYFFEAGRAYYFDVSAGYGNYPATITLSKRAEEPSIAPTEKPTVTEKEEPTTTQPSTSKKEETTAKVPVTAAPITTTTAPTTTVKKEQPVKAKKPAKVTAKKPKSVKEKQIVVTWTKVKNANGYQVAYSTSKKFTKKTTKTLFIKKAKTTKTTLKKLKSGKKYFIKVRAYKTVNKKKVYGAYSKVMNVKVK